MPSRRLARFSILIEPLPPPRSTGKWHLGHYREASGPFLCNIQVAVKTALKVNDDSVLREMQILGTVGQHDESTAHPHIVRTQAATDPRP